MTAPITTPIDLESLKAAAEAATKGPWLSSECERVYRVGDMYAEDGYTTEFAGFEVIGQDDEVVHSPDDGIQKHEDAAFIALWNPATALHLLSLLAEKDARAELTYDGDDMVEVAKSLLPWLQNYPPSTRQARSVEAANAALTAFCSRTAQAARRKG